MKEVFTAGLLKPGLNYEAGEKKEVKNNISAMKQKLAEMQSTKLNWVERLDLVNGLAPLAPELSCKEGLHSMERANRAKQAGGKLEEDVVHNGLKREMLLYRQAQAAVLKGLPRLQSLRVKTKRPDDYFAKMAKSDQHTLCRRDGLNPSSPLFGIFLPEPSSVSLRCRGMIVPQISV